MSRYPEIITVGETSGVTIEEAKKYAGNDTNEMSMVFQFEHVTMEYTNGDKFTQHPVKLSEWKAIMSKWQTELNGVAWNSLYLTNHDQPRSVSRWGDDGKYRKESQKMLYTMLLTMQGTPYVYQGEEIGMTNVKYPSIKDYQDIQIVNAWKERVEEGGQDPEAFLRAVEKLGRDNARTPMQWDTSDQAGFTTGTPWLKVNDNYKEINVKEALDDPNSIYYYMKKLITLRHETVVAVYGDFTEYEPENESLYLYNRSYEGQNLMVILNFTDREQQFKMPEEIDVKESTLYVSNDENNDTLENKTLRPYEAIAYLWK